MIRTDGDRSLKRAWFAKKKLAQIIDMGLPGKTVVLDGFTIGVKQQGGEGKGYVKAPMGLRVYCANHTGIYGMDADYWLGGFNSRAELFSVDNRCLSYELRVSSLNNEEVGHISKAAGQLYANGRPYEYTDENGDIVKAVATTNLPAEQDITEYDLCRLRPYRYGPPSDYYTTYLGMAIYTLALVGAPVSIPFKDSEATITLTNINKAYNSDSTMRSNTFECCFDGYLANGSQVKRRSTTIEKDNFSIGYPSVFNLPGSVFRTVATFQGTLFDTLQSPWTTGYQVPTTIPVGDLSISLATVCEGNWQGWPLRTESEKVGLNQYDFTTRRITSGMVFSGVPSDLVTYMLSPNKVGFYWGRGSTLGSYAWSLAPDAGVELLTIQSRVFAEIIGDTSWVPPYPDVTPKWDIFYTLYKDGPNPLHPEVGCTVITITSDNILGVIDLLHEEKNPLSAYRVFNTRPAYYEIGGYADVDAMHLDTSIPPVMVYDFDQDAGTRDIVDKILNEIIGHPNTSMALKSRIDTIMFHGPLGVYAWSRKYGIKADATCRLIHFSSTGLVLVPCVMPLEVTSIYGVCPNISYAGNDLFLCFCEKVCTETLTDFFGPEVVKIYTGSPFTGWNALPMPTVGRLVHARAVTLATNRVVLLGVIEKPSVGSDPISYRFTFLDRINSGGEWIEGAKIPQDYDTANTWDVSVYGSGEYVKMMQEYLSKPPIVANRAYFSKAVYEHLELK